MLNMIKMDLYRMFRTKSLYIIWVILLGMIIFSVSMLKTDTETLTNEASTLQENEFVTDEPVEIGMTVMLPTQPGEKVTIFDDFYANVQAKFVAIFLVIFAVMFSTADINSGYIKCIGGQVKNRGNLILSKAISLTIYTILSMIIILIVQSIAHCCVFGEILTGDAKDFAIYTLSQTALHIALVLICMTIAILLRNNVISMAIAICMCMNLMMVIYTGINTVIQKLGFEDFDFIKYTVSGRITMVSMTPELSEILTTFVIAAAFAMAVTALASTVFKKRDI